MYEPITTPGCNLDLVEVRTRAREHIKEIDPDFVMLAPQYGPWSQIQLTNQRAPLQIRDLQRKRDVARTLSVFV